MDFLFHLNNGDKEDQASKCKSELDVKLFNNLMCPYHFVRKTYKKAVVLGNLPVSTVSEAKDFLVSIKFREVDREEKILIRRII